MANPTQKLESKQTLDLLKPITGDSKNDKPAVMFTSTSETTADKKLEDEIESFKNTLLEINTPDDLLKHFECYKKDSPSSSISRLMRVSMQERPDLFKRIDHLITFCIRLVLKRKDLSYPDLVKNSIADHKILNYLCNNPKSISKISSFFKNDQQKLVSLQNHYIRNINQNSDDTAQNPVSFRITITPPSLG